MAAQATAFYLVLEKFKATLTDREKRQFAATTIDDLNDAIETIQQRQRSEKKMRAMSRLERFLEGMKEYDKVVSVFLNTSEILAFVWGPMKFLLQIACTFYEAFDALLDAYQRIGEHIPLLSQYEHYFRQHPQVFQLLKLIYEDILNFHQKAMNYFKKPMWRQLFQALWKNFDAEFAGILRNLSEHLALIEKQVTMVHFREILETRASAEREFERQKEEETHRRRTLVHQWLAAANCRGDQETFAKVRRRYPGTGQWLLQKNRFRSWFDPDFCSTHLLWMNGIPGAGKTVLASLIVEEATKLNDVEIAYFYCRFQEGDRSTFLGVARGILSQLLFKDDALLSYLYEEVSKSGQVTLSLESTAEELLATSLKNFPRLYVIIDGVDECEREERRQIVTFFEKIWESLPQNDADSLRCMFISQDDHFARKDFANMPSLKITDSDIQKDVLAYVTARSGDIKSKFDLTTDRQHWIQEQLVRNAEGMFLFVHLWTSYIMDLASLAELEDEMSFERFPQGATRLEDIYSRIIGRLSVRPGSPNAKSLKVLSWLVCAKRPLKWREIQCAVSVDLETPSVSWASSRFRVDSKELYGSLVEIHTDGTVNLVHHTAKKYLLNKHIDRRASETALASLCITYLCFEGFDIDDDNLDIANYIPSGYYGFLDYAYAYWSYHLDACLRLHDSADTIDELSEAAGVFIDLYWAPSQNKIVVPKFFLARWGLLKDNRNFDKLVPAGYQSQRQLIASTAHDPNLQVLKLHKVLTEVRECLEMEVPSADPKRELRLMYGADIFRCPRVNCVRFYDGFDSMQQRDDHVQKHERSFFCSFHGCPFTLLGYATLKDLHKHETEYHKTLNVDDEEEYPELPPEKVFFYCTQCDAKLTRKYNLNLHMRSHNAPNEKKYVCPTCGESFARKGDRTRHETTTHSEATAFVCGGVLKDGSPWGCGRKFNRRDMLNRHWKSVKGKACVLTKQQEEEAEAVSSNASVQPSSASTPQS